MGASRGRTAPDHRAPADTSSAASDAVRKRNYPIGIGLPPRGPAAAAATEDEFGLLNMPKVSPIRLVSSPIRPLVSSPIRPFHEVVAPISQYPWESERASSPPAMVSPFETLAAPTSLAPDTAAAINVNFEAAEEPRVASPVASSITGHAIFAGGGVIAGSRSTVVACTYSDSLSKEYVQATSQPLTPRKCLPDAKQFSINLPSPRTHNLSGSFTPRGERRSARDQTTSGQNDASSVQRNPPPSSAICTPLLQQPSGIATPVLQTGLNLMKPGTPVLQTVGTPLMAFRPPLLNLAAASPGVAAGGTPLLGNRKPTTKEQVEQVEQEQDQREAVDLDCRSESPVASPLPRPETGEGAHVVRTEPPTAMPPQEGGTPGLVTPNLDGADSATPQVSPSVPTVMKNDPRDFPDDDFFGGDRDSSPSVPTASDAVEDDVAAVAPVQNRNLPCEQAVETKEEHHPPHPSEDCAPEATHNDTETRECAAAILDGVIEREEDASGTFSAGGDHDAQPEASRDDDTYSLDEGVESGDSAEIDELVLAASGTNENLPPSVSDAVAAETVDKDLDVALHLQNKEKEDKEPHQAPLTSPQGRPTTTSRMLGFLLGGGGRELPGEDVNGEHALPKDGGEEMKEYIRAAASPSDPLATPNSLCSGGNSQLLAEQDLLFNTCSGGAPSAGTSPMVVGGGGAGPGGSGAVFLQPVVAGVGGVVLASPVDEGRKIAADGLHAGGVPSSSSKKGLCLLTSPLQGENLLMDLTFESFAEELDGKTPSCGTSPAAVFEAGEKKPSAAGATGDGGRMEDEEPIAKFEDVLSDAVGVSSKAAEAQVDLQGSHGVACLLPERDELEPASGAPSPGSVPSPEVETICGDLNEERDPFLATGELVTQDRGNSILQRIVASQPASPELAGAQSNDQNVGQVVTVQGNSCGTASSPSDAEQAGVEPEQKRCTHKLLPAAPKLGWQLPPLAPKAWTSTRAGPGVGLLLPGGQQRQQSNGVAANNLLTPTVEQTSPKRKSQVGSNSGSSIMIPFAPTPRNSTNLVATPEQSGVNTSPNPSSPSPTRGMKHVGGPHLANNSITTAASTNKGSYRRSRPPAMPMLAPPSPVVTSARSLCLTPRCLTPLGPKLDLIRQQSGHLGQVASTPGMPHVQIKTKTEKNERSPLVETSH
eukprot:g17324.t1